MRSAQRFLLGTVLAVLPFGVMAVPTLQLDIGGGFYVGGGEESIMTNSPQFTLYAYATPGNVSAQSILSDTYYLSMALVPKVGPDHENVGSFTVNGTTVNATGDMVYGLPPLEANANPYLGAHGIYDTFFYELAFNFDSSRTAAVYNTEDNAGSGPDTSGSGMYYTAFDIDMSNLLDGYDLHFDLYNTKVKKNGNITLDDFAPFSHDAETHVTQVTEPSTLLLLGVGFLGLGLTQRRLNRRRA